jgi:hypothetical protein
VNPFGTATSTNFTVAPRISSFSPASGPVGTDVTIAGDNFTGATAVRFNGTIASFTVVNSSLITTRVPASATSGPLSVTTAAGTATSAAGFQVLAAPTISGFSPGQGVAGASVTISGTGFNGATAVAFNGTNAVFNVVSSTQISATVPAAATSGKITVTTPVGTATSAGTFVVVVILLGDNVENGTGGWAWQAPWGIATSSSHSATHAWTDSPAGNYGNNANTSLQHSLFLVGLQTARLNFWQRYALSSGDYAAVWILPAGGNWTLLTYFTGTSSAWRQVNVNLDSYIGRSVTIAFQLYSNGSGTADGWYIDDIAVGGTR